MWLIHHASQSSQKYNNNENIHVDNKEKMNPGNCVRNGITINNEIRWLYNLF